MRIISLHVLKCNQDNSFFLSSAYDLSFVSWYQRPFYKETIHFGARTAVSRSNKGQSVAIHLPEAQAMCYVMVRRDGLAYAALADDKYPERIIFMVLRKMLLSFTAKYEAGQFSQLQKDQDLKWGVLQEFIKTFQDPKQVDKLEKLRDELNHVEEICRKNLDDILRRGQKIEHLMVKSKDISTLGYDLFKQSKKVNSRCCSLY